ncbi:MAG: hypothetical protein GY851_04485 [bacterium]|nr:hypothetical protein [bacterium]
MTTLAEKSERDLAQLREYLERNCPCWDRRRPIALIARHLKNITGEDWSWGKVQRLGRELRRQKGVQVCTRDINPKPGMYIPASRSETEEFDVQIEGRIQGLIETQNIHRQLTRERFPQHQLF